MSLKPFDESYLDIYARKRHTKLRKLLYFEAIPLRNADPGRLTFRLSMIMIGMYKMFAQPLAANGGHNDVS